jgi:ABC-2 type transport system ATP-binding protein
MNKTVEVQAVCKSYGNFRAVDSLSLEIGAGEVYGLLGPNGAGKTSSIRMMIGITLPDSGEVRLFGESFERRHLEKIGYLPEERGLYKKMKVGELLLFFAQLKGVAPEEARRRIAYWLERLELQSWREKKIDELSKGMQQKVQFIAAILHDPAFLIMDEPFSGLDPANALELKNTLLELKKAGKTILFSTHRMDQVEKLCDNICLIDHGRSVLQGNLREIKAGYGKSSVQIEYDGELPFLEDKSLIQSANNYGNYVEARMQPGVESQHLLELAIRTARIRRFELVEPSLEQIFIATVEAGKEMAHA